MSVLDLLLGRPLATTEERAEKIGFLKGIPIFGLDALGSAAYGPEAALTLLIPLGVGGLRYMPPITAAIIALLAIVYFSYRQTIAAYPGGGGSYTVATKNLGTFPGVLAAAALTVDYVLVVAVGISAGVGAVVSALPTLEPHTLILCLAVLLLITLVNLRGVRETGVIFMAPTYLFVICMGGALVVGVWKVFASGGHPIPVVSPRSLSLPQVTATTWIVLRAFANGCTALTGVEAVSNGVMAFRDPRVKHARRTLATIIATLILMLAGISFLCRVYHIGATLPGRQGYESVLSQLVGAVAGKGIFYYVAITSILLLLVLQANTAFADFPRVCRAVAHDGFLPHAFVSRGRRLVYTQGIIVLAVLAALVLIAFAGITDRLIPLFAVGAFTAFTLSQAGMTAHWRRTGGRHARHSLAINGFGAVATGVTLIIVMISKFVEGAWITLLVIPSLVLLMYAVRRHYERTSQELASRSPLPTENLVEPVAVVPIEEWSNVAQKALRFALTLSREVLALQVRTEDQPGDLLNNWPTLVEEPTRRAALPIPQLVVLNSPYRNLITPIVDYVLDLERKHPDRHIAVVVPELVEKHWWEFVLHKQHGELLTALLLLKGNERIYIVNVPWHLHV